MPVHTSQAKILLSALVFIAGVHNPMAKGFQNFFEDANERIEMHRKTDIQIEVVDSNGQPVEGADVEINMTRHAFRWGTAVVAHRINSGSADNQIYRQKLLENFNSTVFENDLKWPAWEGAWGANLGWGQAEPALDWLDANNMGVRGHYLSWGTLSGVDGYGPNNPNNDLSMIQGPLFDHIQDKLTTSNDRVIEWDVINHPIGWGPTTYSDLWGMGFYSTLINFSRANALPGTEMWINEDNILNGGGVADEYELLLNFLNTDNALPDGIGIQGHFKSSWGRNLSDTHIRIYNQLIRFSQIVPRIQLTEFDIDVGVYDSNNNLISYDPQEHALLMNNYLISMFSHPDLEGVTMWGFWAGAHWLPTAALFDQNWNEKPALHAYRNLVYDQWWSNETGQTDLTGSLSTRVFKGDYDVAVSYAGNEYSATATFDDQNGSLVVTVDAVLLGDVNRDGAVNLLDVGPFIDLLNNGTFQEEGDMNGDGVVNLLDVDPFIAALGGG